MKFNVKFSAAGDDVNFTLWLNVDSSGACQPSVLARFEYVSMPKRLPAAGKEVM